MQPKPPQRRLNQIYNHLTSSTTPTTNATANLFITSSPQQAWAAFVALPTWKQRSDVQISLKTNATAYNTFLNCYKLKMQPFILPSFYQTLDNPIEINKWKNIYHTTGELNIPLLNPNCLSNLGKYCNAIEHKGKRRYGDPRPSYPPGEWATWDETDPRKSITTEVNMTAVASRHLPSHNDDVLWIYHSPHVQKFIEITLGCNNLFPYLNDLGIAVNIMRPRPTTQFALGMHFDSVDSSNKEDSGLKQAKGVTGVIGLIDAIVGGNYNISNSFVVLLFSCSFFY